MLTLNGEQEQRLRAIARDRGLRRIEAALAAGFPDLARRAAERLPALVAHGAERALRHGLADAVCVGRYLACWFVWGADFESQPEGAWAGHILRQPGRTEGAKAFQLCRRTAEQLLRGGAPGLPTSAAFQSAVSLLDDRLAEVGVLGALVPTPPVRLGAPCDIDACDIRLVETGWRRAYRGAADGRWELLPSPPAGDPVAVVASNREAVGSSSGGGGTVEPTAPAGLPPQLHLLSPSPGEGPAARLRLRSRATHVCDPEVHPLVSLNGASGVSDWRGPFAAEIVYSLPAGPAPVPLRPGAIEPPIAVEVEPVRSLLEASACGLREAGTPIGTLSTRLAVYPAAQRLLVWQREPVAATLAWSEGVSPAAGAGRSPTRCRLERDGQALDAGRWQAGLQALDDRWAEGLSRLLVIWEREARLARGRVDTDASLLTGSAGLTWGWAEGPRGLAEPPLMRVDGRLDLVCSLRLDLAGELELGGSRSLLQLTAEGTTRLQATLRRDHDQPDLAAALKPVQADFRHPFRLQVTPIASDELAVANAAGPATGALVGAYGLRPSLEGPGLQFFARIAIEASQAPIATHHPLLGRHRSMRPLLPAVPLLDWSLG